MSNYNELVQILKELLFNRFYPKPNYIRGLLGDGLGNVLVPGRPDYNLVRFNRTATETFQVFNKEVSQPVDGLPVLLGEFPWQPGLVQVVSVDWSAYAQTGWGDEWAGIQAHAPTHEWPDFQPGSDAINVYLRAVTPLRTQSAGSGSSSVYVTAYEYDGATGTSYQWPGVPPLALGAATPPTGSMRYMGVYLNPVTNSLGVVTGATTIYTDALEPSRPAWPLNVYPSAYVRLYGGQAGITERDIRDARRLWDTTLVFTGSTAAATQAEVNAGTDVSKAVTPSTLTNWEPGRVKNTSGATATAGDVGYINEAGEYKTTTTASDIKAWCVVVTGGVNNNDITVAQTGRYTVNYVGTAPSAGHYLITSTTAGKANRQTYVDPAIFAVCLAAGSGGTVQVKLLCNRLSLQVSSSEDVMRIDSHSGTDFVSTISGAPSGSTLVYGAVSSGNEASIKPTSAGALGKIVLHNTTRGESLLIDSVDTGTNTITFTSAVPGSWVNTDAITARSQTNTATLTGGFRFYDIDLSSADNTVISPLAVAVKGEMLYQDTSAAITASRSFLRHRFETDASANRAGITFAVGSAVVSDRRFIDIPLIQRKFCIACAAEGASTATCYIRVSEVVLAAP